MFITSQKKRWFNLALKPTKQRLFKGKVYGFDIETCNNNKEFVCASIYLDDENKWVFKSKEKLIKFLKTKRFWNSTIAATNLSFDFFGVFYNTKEVMHFNTLFRGSDLIFAKTYIRNRDFHKKSYNGKHRGEITKTTGKRLMFIDTFNYAHISVAKIGKILGMPKIKKPGFLGFMPKNNEEWQELINYNMQDAKISKAYIKFLYDAFEDLGATVKPTIASTAMSLFKNKYLNKIYWRHSKSILKELFKAYYGGRTEAFSRGQIKNYNYYDFNSLYPSVMQMPYPDPNTLRTCYGNNIFYIRNFEGASKVTIHCPKMKYPLLPYRTSGKLIFGYGTFTGWYSHVELRRAEELGYVIKHIHKTHYYKNICFPFKDYVSSLYNKRQAYKKIGSPMEQVVKLLLNSLYGKFGQKFEDRDNWLPFNLTEEEFNKLPADFERVGDFIRIKQAETEPSCFCQPIWALYTTAYARIKMHNAIVKYEPAYVDTDSLITRHEIEESRDLGKLKKEMTISYGLIVKPKFYAFNDVNNQEHIRIKGVGKRLTMLEFNNMLINPVVVYNKFMRFKESIRRGFIPNEIQQMQKELNLEDDKRLWPERFNPIYMQASMPLEIIEGVTELEYAEQMLKAEHTFERQKEKEQEAFFNSDLFDSAAVGNDITNKEFLGNEQDWRDYE